MKTFKFRGIPKNKHQNDIKKILDAVEFYSKGRDYDGNFVYGCLNGEYILGSGSYVTDECYNPSYWVKVDKATIGQYTGLNDREGREIYAGDIVLILDSKRTGIFKIEHTKGTWGYEFNWMPILGYPCSTHILEDGCSNCLIIGNIYEDKKLLEVKSNEELLEKFGFTIEYGE